MLKSILEPNTSVMLGVANGAVILGIYDRHLPMSASIRTGEPHDSDIETARRQSAWMSAGFLGFMFLLTRDRNSFLIGGLVLGSIDLIVKHSNGMDPFTGKLHAPEDTTIAAGLTDNVYPIPDYQETAGSDLY